MSFHEIWSEVSVAITIISASDTTGLIKTNCNTPRQQNLINLYKVFERKEQEEKKKLGSELIYLTLFMLTLH